MTVGLPIWPASLPLWLPAPQELPPRCDLACTRPSGARMDRAGVAQGCAQQLRGPAPRRAPLRCLRICVCAVPCRRLPAAAWARTVKCHHCCLRVVRSLSFVVCSKRRGCRCCRQDFSFALQAWLCRAAPSLQAERLSLSRSHPSSNQGGRGFDLERRNTVFEGSRRRGAPPPAVLLPLLKLHLQGRGKEHTPRGRGGAPAMSRFRGVCSSTPSGRPVGGAFLLYRQ